MADMDYSDLEDLTLTLEDEDGNTTECELNFVFEYEGQDYGAFSEADDEEGAFYFFAIDGKKNWKGELELEIEPVEDDELLGNLAEMLQEIINAEDEDDDDEPELEADDDGYWDQFINKKLDD